MNCKIATGGIRFLFIATEKYVDRRLHILVCQSANGIARQKRSLSRRKRTQLAPILARFRTKFP